MTPSKSKNNNTPETAHTEALKDQSTPTKEATNPLDLVASYCQNLENILN